MMRKLKLLGLCLIAAFAFSVTVAASAQAAKSASGPIKVDSFGGEITLESPAGSVKCKLHTAHGEIVGATTTKEVVVNYKGCEAFGNPCHSAGAKPGEIETKKLVSDLDWVSKPKGDVGVDLRPEAGATLSEFECVGATVKLYGSIIGAITPINTMTTEDEIKFFSEGNKNKPESFEGELPETLEAEVTPPGGKVGAGETRADHTMNHGVCKSKKGREICKPNPSEINTVASGEPQFGRCKSKKGGLYTEGNCLTKAAAAKGKKAKGSFEFFPIPG
jgi:hypothetical protein